jgi:hypothetical protein
MSTESRPAARALTMGLVGVFLILLASCSYDPPQATDFCQEIENLPLTELSAQDRWVVMETPGTIMVMHGFGTAQLGSGDYVKVEQAVDLPPYGNRVTVVLNGWRVSYRGGDEHVRAFGTMIGKIRKQDGQVVWNAIGLLRDNDAKEGYEWTYHYTVIVWDGTALDVLVNHDDAEKFCGADTSRSDNFYFAGNEGTTTALSSFSSFIESPGFPVRGTVAVLPRGFGFVWDDDDHNMLQVGYDIDHGQNLIEPGKKYRKASGVENPLTGLSSLVDSRFVSWDSYCILKDNDNRRDYTFGEMVSACGGSDVGIIRPPFSMLPVEDKGWNEPCVTQAGATESHDGTIDQIAFEYAIPMLTGWQLGYGQAIKGCNDEHIREMGVWIDDWSYAKNPGSPTGTLSYKVSSVFRDKDSDPGHFHGEDISVLAFRPVVPGGIPSVRVADLVPFSPAGTDLGAFCRLEENRKLLRVTVKNVGNGDAGPSGTMVDFGNVRSTQNTPAIPAGGAVDLLFKVPETCFDPECDFRILVDADHQVAESNEGNNAASGSCAN